MPQDNQTTMATKALVGNLQDPFEETPENVKANALEVLRSIFGMGGAPAEAAEMPMDPMAAPMDPNDPINNQRFGDTARTPDPRRVRTHDIGLR